MKNKKVKLLAAAFLLMGSIAVSNTEVQAAQWNVNDYGWWYQEDDGSYPANTWKSINGKWYYFDGNGYMLTGWQEIEGEWYYLNEDGAMALNTWIGDYYLTGNGTMAKNTWIGDYYVGADGRWRTAQWNVDSNGWWYCHADGSYTTNGWESINGYWYYFNGSGYMLTGWQEIGGEWYYLNADGAMASNTWVDDYYLTASGVMAKNTWIGNYYVGPDGKWVQDTATIYEFEVINILNKERVAAGLEPLEYDYQLSLAADVRAKELEKLFDHVRPNGTDWTSVFEDFGIQGYYAGENIAVGYTTPEMVMNAWMGSQGHYENIMGPYTHVGVGCYIDNYGIKHWVQLFLMK